MIRFGYRCEEERYQPSFLLESAIQADKFGFEFVCISDHFHPWFHKNASGAQAWVWMGSAAALTKGIRLGTSVTAPIYRYHPAIIAQSFATLGEMFPGRVFVGLGSGEAMNEAPLGFEWPNYKERFQRFEEAIQIIKLLWNQDFVTFNGKYYKLSVANLYTKPREPVPLYIAGTGPSVTRLAGRLGDGFICGGGAMPDISRPKQLMEWLSEGAKEAGRDVGKMHTMLQICLSYDKDYDNALHSIARWSIQGLDEPGLSKFFEKSLYDPRVMDQLGAKVDLQKFGKRWLVCTDFEEIVKEVERVAPLGYNEIEIYSCSPDERGFLAQFGSKTLPYLQERFSR